MSLVRNENLLHRELTDKIIGTFYDVYNELGYGFLEKVYENALAYELCQRGFEVRQQYSIDVYYRDVNVGHYVADLIVNDLVVLELKVVRELTIAHINQLYNYLKATDMEVGLLLNFGPRPKFERRAYSNNRPNLYKKIQSVSSASSASKI